MAGYAGGFEDYPLAPGSYSELLFGDYISGLDLDGLSGFDSYFSPEEYTENYNNNSTDDKDPKMLCFGDCAKQCNVKMAAENFRITGPKSGPACINSSMTISDKKRSGSGFQNTGSNCGALTGSQKNKKKPKPDSSTVSGHVKDAKREKLRDRITALQQLVSPFGKTDTASVLHEASGYIRFLHDQVQVLSSPYLQSLPTPTFEDDNGDGKEMKIRRKSVLRSRGLCLVPIELTLHVADSNGADLWSSAAAAEPLSRLSKVSLQIA